MDTADRLMQRIDSLPGVHSGSKPMFIPISARAYLPALRRLNKFDQLPMYSHWVAGSIILMPNVDKRKLKAAWLNIAEQLLPNEEVDL